MNLDELQSVQARERQSSDLQHLRSSFYREVGEFINDLNDERARVVDAADDPFSEPEVRQLSDDIETAESTVEAIYERRVGKVVKKASIAAAGMPVDADGLTNEEQALFEDLVDRIERNRDTVLSVLDGNAPSVSCSIDEADGRSSNPGDAATADASPEADAGPDSDPGPDPNLQPSDGVSAADLMGGATDAGSSADAEADTDAGTETPAADPPSAPSATEAPPAGEEPAPVPSTNDAPAESTDDGARPPGDGERSSASTTDPETSDVPGLPRTTVRITADVGEIVGADDRDYDLGTEDVVTLPAPNADVLVEKDAAERL